MGDFKASGRGDRRRGDHFTSVDLVRALPLNESELRSLFQCVPYGLAIVDRERAIVAMNDAFRVMVRAAPGPGASGCELLGCDHAGRSCLFDALAASEPGRGEVMIELPGQTGSVSLSGAPLDGDGERLVVELRRARPVPVPVPDATARPAIRVHVLGRMRVETSAGTVTGGWVEERPGQLLRFLVATRGRVVAVEDIAEALWPTAEFTAVGTVRHLVHVLRGRLDPDRRRERAPSCIVSSRGGYTLDPGRVAIDADEFADEATRALTAFSAGDDAAEQALESALARYHGEFLGDELYADWAYAERERLREQAERLLWALSDLALARGDIALATTRGERLAVLEPFDSDIQRQVIALLLRAGRRSRALRQYQAFALRLPRAFGELPEFTLEELMHDGTLADYGEQRRWRHEPEARRSHG